MDAQRTGDFAPPTPQAKREAAVRLQAHTRGWMARSETRKVVTEQTLQQEMKSAIEGRLSERRARREELIGSLISVQRFIRKTQVHFVTFHPPPPRRLIAPTTTTTHPPSPVAEADAGPH